MHQCDSKDKGGSLFNYFKDVIKGYITNKAIPFVNSQNGNSVVTAYIKIWSDYAMLVKLLDRMFDYLNRYYLKNLSLKMLGVTALEIFNSHFYEGVKETFRNQVLLNFTKDRNGDIVDRDLMRDSV
jgi:Cullin family